MAVCCGSVPRTSSGPRALPGGGHDPSLQADGEGEIGGLVLVSHQVASKCPGWPLWGLGQLRTPPGSCPVRPVPAEQVWGSFLLKTPFGLWWALSALGLRGWRSTEGDPQNRGVGVSACAWLSEKPRGSPKGPQEDRACCSCSSRVGRRTWSGDLSSFRPVALQAGGWHRAQLPTGPLPAPGRCRWSGPRVSQVTSRCSEKSCGCDRGSARGSVCAPPAPPPPRWGPGSFKA